MNRRRALLPLAALGLIILASCGSSGIYGGNDNSTYSRTMHGTVDTVDLNSNSIVLMNTSGYNTSTNVMFNGRSYLPGDLVVGDQVTISTRTATSGRQIAQNIDVTRSMSSSSSSQYATIRGTVRSIDTYNHTIQLESTSYIS